MRLPNRSLAVATLLSAAVLAGALAIAAQPEPQQPGSEQAQTEPPSPDLLPNPAQQRLVGSASLARVGAAAAAPTLDEVGDVDSFGRAVRWLGVTQMDMALSAVCDDPAANCTVLAPAPAATAFQYEDAGRIVLPPKAAHSLLCYWLSPFQIVTYSNPTAAPVVARLRYTPTLTVENEVLDDPALVDPTTGLPFGGRLTTGMTSSESFEVPLPAGTTITQRTRDSAVCIAGFLTRRGLVDTYGLTEAQAKEFFKKRTTVRMNLMAGQAQYVSNASLIFGFRIVGD